MTLRRGVIREVRVPSGATEGAVSGEAGDTHGQWRHWSTTWRTRLRGPLAALPVLVLLMASVNVGKVRAAPDMPAVWSAVPSANASSVSGSGNGLIAVTAVSPNDVWAVGSYNTPTSPTLTLTEHWNGAQWTVAPSPNGGVAGDSNVLNAVAAISTNDVWAVGTIGHQATGGSRIYTGLIEHWNGSQWNIVPSPSASGQGDITYLNAVAAVSTNDVWAVGEYVDASSGHDFTFVEQWNGSAWNIVPSANMTGSVANGLMGVTVISGTNVWAVGFYGDAATEADLTLAEQWNGSTWSVKSTPNAGDAMANNFLQAVSAVSATDFWAVGYTVEQSTGVQTTLIEQWNGASWSIVPSVNPGSPQNLNALYGVAAVAANEVWAVGTTGIPAMGPPEGATLIERWNGTTWSAVASANPGGPQGANGLNAVVALSARSVWAVGYFQALPAGLQSTLTERYGYLIYGASGGRGRSGARRWALSGCRRQGTISPCRPPFAKRIAIRIPRAR